MYCEEQGVKGICGGPVKPDIVFYGEGLPARFWDVAKSIKDDCDLLIVMGTTLAVPPFCHLVNWVGKHIPKVLINLHNTHQTGFNFDSKEFPERLFLQGKCDDLAMKIAEDCEWDQNFKRRIVKCAKKKPDIKELQKAMAELTITSKK